MEARGWDCLRSSATCSFFAVDLAQMCMTAPARAQALLSRVMRLAEGRAVAPAGHRELPPRRSGLRHPSVGGAGHAGKLVLTVPRTGCYRVSAAPERFTPFRRDGAYIVTGGLGGLGLFLAARCPPPERIASSSTHPFEAHRRRGRCARRDESTRHRGSGDRGTDIAEAIDLTTRLVEAATATGLRSALVVLHGAAVIMRTASFPPLQTRSCIATGQPRRKAHWHLHAANTGATTRLDSAAFLPVAALSVRPDSPRT